MLCTSLATDPSSQLLTVRANVPGTQPMDDNVARRVRAHHSTCFLNEPSTPLGRCGDYSVLST